MRISANIFYVVCVVFCMHTSAYALDFSGVYKGTASGLCTNANFQMEVYGTRVTLTFYDKQEQFEGVQMFTVNPETGTFDNIPVDIFNTRISGRFRSNGEVWGSFRENCDVNPYTPFYRQVPDTGFFKGRFVLPQWSLPGIFSASGISSGYGDDWPSTECGGITKKHMGIDYPAPVGTPVYPARGGVVKKIFNEAYAIWKTAVVVEHHNPSFTTVYWHIEASVSKNDLVTTNTIIGRVASLPTTGPHLHLGIRRGPYDERLSVLGSLPTAIEPCLPDPTYPENFIDPALVNYGNRP